MYCRSALRQQTIEDCKREPVGREPDWNFINELFPVQQSNSVKFSRSAWLASDTWKEQCKIHRIRSYRFNIRYSLLVVFRWNFERKCSQNFLALNGTIEKWMRIVGSAVHNNRRYRTELIRFRMYRTLMNRHTRWNAMPREVIATENRSHIGGHRATRAQKSLFQHEFSIFIFQLLIPSNWKVTHACLFPLEEFYCPRQSMSPQCRMKTTGSTSLCYKRFKV